MTKRQFCAELADRTGLDLKTAKAFFEVHEDLVMEVIATEDEINFSWGKIFGFFREPRKVYGMYANKEGVIARGGWSLAKSGLPGIEWSYDAKSYTTVDPTELYCDWEEAKFTSKARQYRQDRGLPEIPEYDGLPEKMIVSLCKKADEKRYGKKTKKQIKEETQIRLKRIKTSNTRKYLMKVEWVEQKVREGVMTKEEAQKTPMSVILEEKREQWQDLIRRYEENPLSFENNKDLKKIGKLNPYEIYKENSMAEYYRELMEVNELSDEQLIQIMKEDIDDLYDEAKEEEAKESEKTVEKIDIDKLEEEYDKYDEEGYRVNDKGERIEYWKTWK